MATVERKRPVDVAAVRRTEAIQLRIAGHSQDAVAAKLGITQQRISAIEREWLASRQPSNEATEERRQKQLAGIDHVRAKLFDVLDRLTIDTIPEEEWLPIVDRIDKLWAREARLMGLDLQQGVSVTLVTREALAAALWNAEDVVDVVPVEITEGGA